MISGAVAKGERPVVMTLGALAAERRAELDAIQQQNGVITPSLVVERAASPTSPLHGLFEWDDSEAGQKYRLLQAANYIRAKARVISIDGSDRVLRARAYVSLTTERGEGAYLALDDVLDNPARRAQLVADALAEYTKFREKWKHLEELDRVFAASDAAIAELG